MVKASGGTAPIQDPEVALLDVPREHLVYLLTEVTDTSGNWVRYEYTSDDRAELTRIHANDGRDIRVFYKSSPVPTATNSRLVDRVEVNGRDWDYDYYTHPSGNFSYLSHVSLPDGRQWVFDNGQGLVDMSSDSPYNFECENGGPAVRTFSLKHPNGITGSFTLRETRHLKGDHYSEDAVSAPSSPTPASFQFPANMQCARPTARPRNWPLYRTMSVVTKTLSGPDYPAASWSYQYSGYTSGAPILATKWTEITNPLGHVTRYTYHRFGPYEGLMDKMEVRASAGGPIINSSSNTYIQGGDPGIDTGISFAAS